MLAADSWALLKANVGGGLGSGAGPLGPYTASPCPQGLLSEQAWLRRLLTPDYWETVSLLEHSTNNGSHLYRHKTRFLRTYLNAFLICNCTCVCMCVHVYVYVCVFRAGLCIKEEIKERAKYIPNVYQHFQNNFPATIFFSSSKCAITYVNWLFIYVIIYIYHIYDYMHAYIFIWIHYRMLTGM